ncbi:uncharacterized protein LOC105212895 isoform X2 [Zeugodacus cucurbitae]|uniref:uncharacterized protein LOC105212895 isoform X2 n=1 Tax=Zeugodacus cucurbitae TaxID=28588 RepID=UPI0005968F1D|nr:uncharacterized protein LOC105212895 isoform X2 [Zeugodacus cucurbitae]
MDLKALLLNSISSKQPLLLNRRMHIGKCCYSVTFEVDGKMLNVIRIRQVYTKAPFQMRVQRRQRFLQKLKSCSSLSVNSDLKPKDSPTRTIIPQFADCSTQTSKPQMRSRSTETEVHTLPVHREQQTSRRVLRKQSTQTDPNTLCHGVQTEHRILARATQTNESCAEATPTQTEYYCYNNQVQTEPIEDDISAEHEKEAVVFMLNEIGEMIINQNHLLQNNTTMLSQMSEMALLNKVAAQKKNMRKNTNFSVLLESMVDYVIHPCRRSQCRLTKEINGRKPFIP